MRKNGRPYLWAALGFVLVVSALGAARIRVHAQHDDATYVGAQVCAGCHQEQHQTWSRSVHWKTDLRPGAAESKKGCEACHGPGSAHLEAGGGKGTIGDLRALDPGAKTKICLACHNQKSVMLFPTSPHAGANMACTDCHDAHDPTSRNLLRGIQAAKTNVEGLQAALAAARRAAADSPAASDERRAALAMMAALKKRDISLTKGLDDLVGRYRKTSEPEACYACHAATRAQMRLPSHHPILEGKMKCTGCHNPHGGIQGNLIRETVPETCYKCHGEVEGPYAEEHPPVTEDCTICHKPHGSVNNKLLAQPQPHLCLRCHKGSHTGYRTGGVWADPDEIGKYFGECTTCHLRIHGSEVRASFRW